MEENITITAKTSDSTTPHTSMMSSICADHVPLTYLTTFHICKNKVKGRFVLSTFHNIEDQTGCPISLNLCEVYIYGKRKLEFLKLKFSKLTFFSIIIFLYLENS